MKGKMEGTEERELRSRLKELYAESGEPSAGALPAGESRMIEEQVIRFQELLVRHEEMFAPEDTALFSTPGRSELGGNHTDHNDGLVLATAIDLDTVAAVSQRGRGPSSHPVFGSREIRICSEGFPPVSVCLDDFGSPGGPHRAEPRPEEKGRAQALLRGVVAGFLKRGLKAGGFAASTTTRVLKGSGLSSSAAFEVLIADILNRLFNGGRLSAFTLARIGQEAENEFFGKPSGLMDQLACARGGIIRIDFRKEAGTAGKTEPPHAEPAPKTESLTFNFEKAGCRLGILDTGGDHADLTPQYASIPEEMKQTAAFFGREILRGLRREELEARLPELRRNLGDRALLRSFHFLRENDRVREQAEALKTGDLSAYLRLVKESGQSSACFLQNLYHPGQPRSQALPLALLLTETFLGGEGACRVHGGGFAGTIQVYLPLAREEAYRRFMEPVFGPGCFTALRIRRQGPVRLL